MFKSNAFARNLIALALFGALAPAAYANLLTNGSFEQGVLVDDGNATMTLVPGGTAITGWTAVSDNIAWIEAGNPFSLSAQDGDRFLDLTDYISGAPFGGVTQAIATTSGQSYVLAFELGTLTSIWGGPPVSILATAGGATQSFTSNAVTDTSTWVSFSLPFIATGSTTAITLTGAAGFNYIGLDNVTVEEGAVSVSSPGTLGLLGLGLAALGFSRRRKV